MVTGPAVAYHESHRFQSALLYQGHGGVQLEWPAWLQSSVIAFRYSLGAVNCSKQLKCRRLCRDLLLLESEGQLYGKGSNTLCITGAQWRATSRLIDGALHVGIMTGPAPRAGLSAGANTIRCTRCGKTAAYRSTAAEIATSRAADRWDKRFCADAGTSAQPQHHNRTGCSNLLVPVYEAEVDLKYSYFPSEVCIFTV